MSVTCVDSPSVQTPTQELFPLDAHAQHMSDNHWKERISRGLQPPKYIQPVFSRLYQLTKRPREGIKIRLISVIHQTPDFLPQWRSQTSLTLKALKYLCINHGDQRVFFKFEITINVLFSSFWFIWIPMSWVYGRQKYVHAFSTGTVFIRQNLTSTDVKFWRIKTVPALKGLKLTSNIKPQRNTVVFHCNGPLILLKIIYKSKVCVIQ